MTQVVKELEVLPEHRMARTKVRVEDQEPWTWEAGVCQIHPNDGAARAGQDPPVQTGRQRPSKWRKDGDGSGKEGGSVGHMRMSRM